MKVNIRKLEQRSEELTEKTQHIPGTELIPEIRGFILEVRDAGKDVPHPDDRDRLRDILLRWGQFVYERSGEYIDITLEPSQEIAARIPTRESVLRSMCNRVLRMIAGATPTLGRALLAVAVVGISLMIWRGGRCASTPTHEVITLPLTPTPTMTPTPTRTTTPAPTETPAPTVTPLPPTATDVEVTIKSPEDGDPVGRLQQVRVEYRGLTKGSKIYIVVELSGNEWWPKADVEVGDSGAVDWIPEVRFADVDRQGEEQPFDLLVIVAEDKRTQWILSDAAARRSGIARSEVPEPKVVKRIKVWRQPSEQEDIEGR